LRGNSDFDVRHNFSAAVSYDLPHLFRSTALRAMLDNWGLDDRFTARTGFPVPLQGSVLTNAATGEQYYGGLDRIAGQPVYLFGQECDALYGKQCPGGRAVNPSAFRVPIANGQGSAPRNFVRGFGAWQMDLALRRDFAIFERLRLQFRAEAFNLFNHPSFGAINPTYCSPVPGSTSFAPGCTFGLAKGTLASSLGGLNALYQVGGARSMQFSLRLSF
jgi:hypothetical protein